jgi:hypothetical protein
MQYAGVCISPTIVTIGFNMEILLSFIGIVVLTAIRTVRRMNKLRSFNAIRKMNARSQERRIARRIY